MERTKITVEELLERYTAGERNFEKIILEYADLSGVELRNINFGGAIFSYVNLNSIHLRQCDLRTQFIYCNFINAVIENYDLERARFYDCDLRGASSKICNLTSIHFTFKKIISAAKCLIKFLWGEHPCLPEYIISTPKCWVTAHSKYPIKH